ncbi:MAG: uracil-DNA glycosylase [Chloroflexota bacterium]|nr:uracil-DNA glycosylase [Chloroflexota bacterium]
MSERDEAGMMGLAGAGPRLVALRTGAVDVAPQSPRARPRLALLADEVAGCRRCVGAGLLAEVHPVWRGRGTSRARLLVVGQAPGASGHLPPKPFTGAAGRTLRQWFAGAGFPEDAIHDGSRVFLTSVTKCFPGPGPGDKGDRMPSPAEVALCRPYLDREFALVRPRVVLVLGRLAATELVGRRPLTDLVGPEQVIERLGRTYPAIVLPHPSGISRWLNDPEHQLRHRQALAGLADLRERFDL